MLGYIYLVSFIKKKPKGNGIYLYITRLFWEGMQKFICHLDFSVKEAKLFDVLKQKGRWWVKQMDKYRTQSTIQNDISVLSYLRRIGN